MSENNWFYAKAGTTTGPIPESEVAFLLETGKLTPSSLVWADGMKEWERADQVPCFGQALQKLAKDIELPVKEPDEATLLSEDPPMPHPSFQGRVRSTPAQPWTRYFARSLDLTIAQTIYFALGGESSLLFDWSVMAKFAVPFLASWVVIETFFLTYWGTTPGKWLLGIEISTEQGDKLHWKQALRRSAEVWVRGMALGIPLLTPLAQIHAYSLLTQQGVTTWDRITHTIVRHKQVPASRWFVVMLLLYGVYSNLGGFLL